MTDSDAIKLVPPPTADESARQDAVQMLKEALADAEAGSVLGCVVATKDTDGLWTHRASRTFSVREEIGALVHHVIMRVLRTEGLAP